MNFLDEDFIIKNEDIIELRKIFDFLYEHNKNICIINNYMLPKSNIEKRFKEHKLECIFNDFVKSIPNNIYKYYSNLSDKHINFSHEAIRTGEVYLSHPKDFNDPFDSKFIIYDDKKFICKLSNRYISYLYNNIKFEDLEDDVDKSLDKLSKIIHDKLESMDEKCTIQEKLYNIFNVPDTKKFNDFSLTERERFILVNNIVELKRISVKNEDISSDLLYSIFERYLNIIKLYRNYESASRISCFTTKKDNMLMWSHYANGHRGFCIEYSSKFDTSFDYVDWCLKLFPVIYSDKMEDFTDDFVDNYFRDSLNDSYIKNLYYKVLLSKDIKWCYENEFRLIKFLDLKDPIEKEAYNSGIGIKFETFPIKSVYLGYKMENEQKDYIINLIKEKNKYKEKNIDVYQMVLRKDGYGVEPTKVLLD